MLYEQFERKGLALPPGERKWSTNHLARLEQVLRTNEKLQTGVRQLSLQKSV
jgi:hypothetical protein